MAKDFVAEARKKRSSESVIFAKFMTVRGAIPDTPIFVIEGKEDVGVWPVWVNRAGFEEPFEPLPCSGKENVLKLRDRLMGELSFDPGKRVFIVDRDYDELKGYAPTSCTFVTDRYAIENYFMEERVLEFILNTDFECSGSIQEKKSLIEEFVVEFGEYVESTYEIHFQVYCLRKSGQNTGRALPNTIRKIASVQANGRLSCLPDPNNVISFDVNLSQEEIETYRSEFEKLDVVTRFRGKFHRMFLNFFLQKLQDDRDRNPRIYFSTEKKTNEFKFSGVKFSQIAGVSPFPLGLTEFLAENFEV
ncbi:DUF4435 domain-containing protein [Phaeobacter sp. 11ANDIMAR09]|uniref:DUF4435 domain-containing protein n=1 Tax=Phaeobacter sp. 11ANDIMAR09 TaxID=1225647 RepID=UPI0006C85802|nr:DUF4435 domain-containing protein [Phaeobacter sp. 11ANDIMAR09]